MKRSSKKYRNAAKKAGKKSAKKFLATGMMVCLGTLPVWSDDEVLLTLFPNASKSFGSDAGVQYDFGVGGKLTWRINGNLDFFVEGDYKNLTLPNVSSATLLNGGVGAGYHIPISDRWGMNLSAQVGGYRASKSDGVLTGLSGGINVSFTCRINPTVSVEAGVGANHYMASPSPLMTDVGASAGLTVNLTKAFTNPTKIKMETKEILPVFPVLYSWYKSNSFASVGITNEEDTSIENVQVSFYQPQYMTQPNVCATKERLGKGETFDAELTAFFNERMLDLTEKTNTEASVIIEYTYLGQKKKKTISMVVPVYGRNSMSWDDDRRASVFVSAKDPAALWFSKYITSIVRDNVRMGISPNIQYAMGIFETLDQFGINYVIDPSSAYSDNVGGASIDFLQFPYQTLTYRGGDCDDLSILVCSLFEAVGIKTAFITIPGHIFMAFDSGMTMKEAAQSLMNSNNLINHNGEAWVPLEITLTDEGFSRAWRVGAREWNQAFKDGTSAFYAMEDSWKIYEPVSVPGASANFTLPDKKIVSRLFQHSMDQWVSREISPVVAQYNARLAANDTVELRNELGILYGQYGLFVEADDQFKRARRKGYLPSLLNTANVYFVRQQYTIALEWYKKVLETEPDNELAILGVARCHYELENYDDCDEAFDVVRNMNPKLAAEYTYLGAFEQTRGRSFSLADRIAMTKWDTGSLSSGITNTGDDGDLGDSFENEDSNGFVIADLDTSIPGSNLGGDADSLLSQLADMNNPTVMLRPDAEVQETDKTAILPPDAYAAMDDYDSLVEELPGLLAQLRLPEMSFDSAEPVILSDYNLIASTTAATSASVTDSPTVEESRYVPKRETPAAKDLTSLVNKSATSAPVSSTPETPEAVAPTAERATSPVETPSVPTPTVEVATTTEETPAAVTPTVEVATTTEDTPATVTPTVEITASTEETPEVTAPKIEIAATDVPTPRAETPTIEEARRPTEETPAAVTPTVEITATTEETPEVSAPKIEIAATDVPTPRTETPKIEEARRPTGETPATVAPTVEVATTTEENTAAVTPEINLPEISAPKIEVAPKVEVTLPEIDFEPKVETAPVAEKTREDDIREMDDASWIDDLPEFAMPEPVVEEKSPVAENVASDKIPEPVIPEISTTADINPELSEPTVSVSKTSVEPPAVEKKSREPVFETPEVIIESTDDFIAELGLDEEDVFGALMDDFDNNNDDEFAGTPIEKLIMEDERPVSDFGPSLDLITKNDEVAKVDDQTNVRTDEIPVVERKAPRFSAPPSSEWVPEEVYNAKIIPGMKTYEEEMESYGKDKSYLYEDNTGLLSDDTEEAIAMEIAMEQINAEEEEKKRLALENWDKVDYNYGDETEDGEKRTVDFSNDPLFSYLSDSVLDEIQTVSIVDKIREQGQKTQSERYLEKKKGLLAKTAEIVEKEAEEKSKKTPKVKRTVVPEPVEVPIAETSEGVQKADEKLAMTLATEKKQNIIEENDSLQKDTVLDDSFETKKSGSKWPYVAGGSGLFGLFILFLIVFWKRDDDDDEEKDSLEKQGVNV